jgi:hypothetical protein
VRTAWADPLAWAGLAKVPRDETEVVELLTDHVGALERELSDLDSKIATERTALRGLRAQARSLEAHHHAHVLAQSRGAEALEREAALNRLIATRTQLDDERRTHLDTLAQPLAPEPPQAHLKTPHGPLVKEQERRRRFLALWSVLSAPLLLASIVVVLNARPLTWIATIAALGGLFMGVEAFARRRFASFVASALLLVAAIALGAGFVLLFHQHWRLAISIVVGGAALALLIGNLGDLRHGWRRV